MILGTARGHTVLHIHFVTQTQCGAAAGTQRTAHLQVTAHTSTSQAHSPSSQSGPHTRTRGHTRQLSVSPGECGDTVTYVCGARWANKMCAVVKFIVVPGTLLTSYEPTSSRSIANAFVACRDVVCIKDRARAASHRESSARSRAPAIPRRRSPGHTGRTHTLLPVPRN